MGCVFCEIAARRLPAGLVYEDEAVIAFHDRSPQAPLHVLVVPKRHVACAADVDDPALWADLMTACQTVARQLECDSFRLVVNSGAAAGQTVPHLHVHLLSGRFDESDLETNMGG